MRPAEKALVHQVHPVKIGMDVTASVISNALLWRGHPKAALAVRAVLPVAPGVPQERHLTRAGVISRAGQAILRAPGPGSGVTSRGDASTCPSAQVSWSPTPAPQSRWVSSTCGPADPAAYLSPHSIRETNT